MTPSPYPQPVEEGGMQTVAHDLVCADAGTPVAPRSPSIFATEMEYEAERLKLGGEPILTPARMASLLAMQHRRIEELFGALSDLSTLFDDLCPDYRESTVAANARAAMAKTTGAA
jgi:hypothetical protein